MTRTAFHPRKLASGRWLLAKHGTTIDSCERGEGGPDRSHLSAWLSEDEGLSWQGGGLVLDERDGVSYPDGFQAPARFHPHLV